MECFTMKSLSRTNSILLLIIGIHFSPNTYWAQRTYNLSAGCGLWSETMFGSFPAELNGFKPEMSPSFTAELSIRQLKGKKWNTEIGVSYQSVHSTLLISELTDPYNLNLISHFVGFIFGGGYSNQEFHRRSYLSFSGNIFIFSSVSSGIYEERGNSQEKILNLYGNGNFSAGILYGIEPNLSYNYLLGQRRKNTLFIEAALRAFPPNGTSSNFLMLPNVKLGYRLRFK